MRIFLQTFQADGGQVAVHAPAEAAGMFRLRLNDRTQGFQGRRPEERRLAKQHFVKDGAEAVDVRRRAGVLAVAAGLLRGHVGGRAEDGSGCRRRNARPAHYFGEAEVGEVRLAGGIDDDVGRLDVAVQHAAPVRVVHGANNLAHQPDGGGLVLAQAGLLAEGGGRAKSFRADELVQPSALDEFHAEERASLMFADVVNGDDVRVPQTAGGFRLDLDAVGDAGKSRRVGAEHLEGDDPFHGSLPRLVNDAHHALLRGGPGGSGSNRVRQHGIDDLHRERKPVHRLHS